MTKKFLKFTNVSFSYETSIEYILDNLSFHLAEGWTGIVGPNGSGKSTLLKLASGLLQSSNGNIKKPDLVQYCDQRTDYLPDNYKIMLNDYDKYSLKLIETLGLKDDWLNRWNTLSHGERKRIQIGTALWAKPELLAIDEPTNHLDSVTRLKLINALKSFTGVGLLVSHDRELLDELCTNIIFVENSSATVRPGGITEATETHNQEIQSAVNEYNLQKNTYLKLENEIKSRMQLAEKSKRKSSKKRIHKNDHDAKAKIDSGRLTGKDAIGGKLKRQLEGRVNQAKAQFENLSLPQEKNLGVFMPSRLSSRNYHLLLEEKNIYLNKDISLLLPHIQILPGDRIALTGSNGSGKSTLIKMIIDKLKETKDKYLYIPQEISLDETAQVIGNIKALPNEKLGKLLIIVSRLGSDAKRILETELPSPGETRKLLLALGILNEPEIIIMDEPTNHLDLPSIKCLETALHEVVCTLLLVSHDKIFLQSVCSIYWQIRSKDKRTYELKISL